MHATSLRLSVTVTGAVTVSVTSARTGKAHGPSHPAQSRSLALRPEESNFRRSPPRPPESDSESECRQAEPPGAA